MRARNRRPVLPAPFPPDAPSAPTLMFRLARDAEKKAARKRAEKWFKVKVQDRQPIGICWFGDPHLGSNTAWDKLLNHVEICASTPGMYAANLGDTSNNWAYRLVSKYQDESVTKRDERALIRWFLADAGIKWLAWIMGNHDAWDHGAELIRAMDVKSKIPMLDWEARFIVEFPGGAQFKMHAAHDFPGYSMYNPTHANARAVRWLQSGADLYVCGHRHTFGIQQFQLPESGQCPMLVRAAGYKIDDEFARRKGFPEATEGQSVVTILDPSAGPAGRVLAFADVAQAARVLRALRSGRGR